MFRFLALIVGALAFSAFAFASAPSEHVAADPGDTVPSSTAPFTGDMPCPTNGNYTQFVTLTAGDDVYHTDPTQRTKLRALGGNDRIYANGYLDCIDLGDGNDFVDGGANKAGWIAVSAGAGNDSVNGTKFSDALVGGSGRDSVNGRAGTDVCRDFESGSCEHMVGGRR